MRKRNGSRATRTASISTTTTSASCAACCSTSCPIYCGTTTAISSPPHCCTQPLDAIQPRDATVERSTPGRSVPAVPRHTIMNMHATPARMAHPGSAIAAIKKKMSTADQRPPMIDHIGFLLSDYAKSEGVLYAALAPLGYTLLDGYGARQDESRAPAAGFGQAAIRISGCGGAVLRNRCMSPIVAKGSRQRRRLPSRALAGRGKDHGAPSYGRLITPIITAPLCLIRTPQQSRPSGHLAA